MNISDIRNMSDKELNHFLGMAQKNNHRICEKCGDFIIDKTTITVRKGYTTRTLCTLCNNCYADLVEFLGIKDVDWSD